MINNNIFNKIGVIFAFIVLVFTSCHYDDVGLINPEHGQENKEEQEGMHTIKMVLDVSKTNFDAPANGEVTRSTSSVWKDGDKLYLRFHADNGVVLGNAIFNIEDQDWTLSYYGTLKRDIRAKVEITYIAATEPIAEEDNLITLQSHWPLYQDIDAAYLYPRGESLSIVGNLKPITGRIRFKGDTDKYICVGGLKVYEKFDLNSGEFIGVNHPAKFVELYTGYPINETTGYTEYIYGMFQDVDSPQLKINDGEHLFTAECTPNMLVVGKSGYMTIPIVDSHNGWQMSVQQCWGVEQGHLWADLGLPSGILWADENVGADQAQWQDDGLLQSLVGLWCCWGQTSSNNSGSGGNIQGSKYYDTAKDTWGGNWVMPTKDDFQELIEYCYFDYGNPLIWSCEDSYEVHLVTVFGPNGNSIIMPYYYYNQKGYNAYKSYYVNYWTATGSGNTGFAYLYEYNYDSCRYDAALTKAASVGYYHTDHPNYQYLNYVRAIIKK